jgi:iron only hydrogenase large subunit-like protein
VIAQPCPAIVSYIEIYQPRLLPYLAPADSPMLHTIKMIREYYPQYKDHKVAVISPCIAKRREFDETGLGDYNVTMLALKRRLEKDNVDIASFPEIEYTGPRAERAVGFSSPGGLLDTAERFVPGIRRKTCKMEGVHSIYPYLEEMAGLLDSNIALALLIDCLNCEKGCNGGPGTGNGEKPLSVLENPVRKRRAGNELYHKSEKGGRVHRKYHKVLHKFWKKDLYSRSYHDLSGNNTLKRPSEGEFAEVYRLLRKYTEADIYNCTACGYGSCEAMAVAIYNKLNKPQNCLHYSHSILAEERKTVEEINRQFSEHIAHTVELIEGINKAVKVMDFRIGEHLDAVDDSSVVADKIIGTLRDTSEFSRRKQETIQGFVENAAKGQESMQETIKSVESIARSVDGIASAIKIIGAIAANTNLLAMNAAIEAAHAGEAGRGFAVVADEIRRLSESTRENSRNISQTLSSIIEGINITSKRSNDTNNLISAMSREIGGFAAAMTEMINALTEMTEESAKITSALKKVQSNSNEVKTGYSDMLDKTGKIINEMNSLVKETSEKMAEI